MRFPSATILRNELVKLLQLKGQPGGFATLGATGKLLDEVLGNLEIQALHDGPVNSQTGNPTFVFDPQELVLAFKDSPNLAGALQVIIDARIAARRRRAVQRRARGQCGGRQHHRAAH
ncbi:MAG: hypothetical protein WKG07_32685 [Hymenobacter sp.]